VIYYNPFLAVSHYWDLKGLTLSTMATFLCPQGDHCGEGG